MAQKRMFDKSIIDTERFYELPIESQLLYFHLGLHADVKGFVEPKKIARLVGVKLEAIKPLIMLNFVIPFESGVVVIREWNLHNSIREDREAPTRFIDELAILSITDNDIYEVQEDSGSSPAQYSIEEGSIEEDREEKKETKVSKKTRTSPKQEDTTIYEFVVNAWNEAKPNNKIKHSPKHYQTIKKYIETYSYPAGEMAFLMFLLPEVQRNTQSDFIKNLDFALLFRLTTRSGEVSDYFATIGKHFIKIPLEPRDEARNNYEEFLLKQGIKNYDKLLEIGYITPDTIETYKLKQRYDSQDTPFTLLNKAI
jgi:hypothetical protein